MNTVEELNVRNLNYLIKTYDSITDVMTKTQQRLVTVLPESVDRYGEDGKGRIKKTNHEDLKDFHNHKERLKRKIKKELNKFPIYTEWLVHIKGIGEAISANLILLYYYKFQPICKKCGNEIYFEKDKKKCEKCETPLKNGIFDFVLKKKDFANISKWWSYMGQGADKDGNKPKHKKGESSNFNKRGRYTTWLVSEQFIKTEGKYREFYDYRKKKRMKTHPTATNGHRHNMAKHETAKVFLAHFWLVARTLDGKNLTKPYKEKWYLTKPFYFDMKEKQVILDPSKDIRR
jgi:hypothetical protein